MHVLPWLDKVVGQFHFAVFDEDLLGAEASEAHFLLLLSDAQRTRRAHLVLASRLCLSIASVTLTWVSLHLEVAALPFFGGRSFGFVEELLLRVKVAFAVFLVPPSGFARS